MAEHTLEPLSPFTDARTLELADAIEVQVPRGEPRKLLAAVADALAGRQPAGLQPAGYKSAGRDPASAGGHRGRG